MTILPWISIAVYSALNCWASRSKVHHSWLMNACSSWAQSSFYLLTLLYILQITHGKITPGLVIAYGGANAVGSLAGMAFSLKYLRKFEKD